MCLAEHHLNLPLTAYPHAPPCTPCRRGGFTIFFPHPFCPQVDLFAAIHHHVANAGATALEHPTLCLDSILLHEAAAGAAPARSAFAAAVAQPALEEASVAVAVPAVAQARPPTPPEQCIAVASAPASERLTCSSPAALPALPTTLMPAAPAQTQGLCHSLPLFGRMPSSALFGFDDICLSNLSFLRT